jgi:hypothetical protein
LRFLSLSLSLSLSFARSLKKLSKSRNPLFYWATNENSPNRDETAAVVVVIFMGRRVREKNYWNSST